MLAEIHDSIVVTSPPDADAVRSTIRTVTDIMCHPFKGFLESDPVFPVRVSVGRRWKKWKQAGIYYE